MTSLGGMHILVLLISLLVGYIYKISGIPWSGCTLFTGLMLLIVEKNESNIFSLLICLS